MGLSYCGNLVPVQSFQDLCQIVLGENEISALLQRRLCGVGWGLWVPDRVVTEALLPENRAEWARLRKRTRLFVESLNGFPLGNFHAEQVKSSVYFPHWADPARYRFTLKLVQLATGLMREGQELSISTLPLGDRISFQNPRSREHACLLLTRIADHLFRLEGSLGLRLNLALEPEPLCYLETAADLVRFFREDLLPIGVPILCQRLGMPATRAEEIILNYIRVCYDTCHAALLFQEPEEFLETLSKGGIRLGKIQITSALSFRCQNGVTLEGRSILECMKSLAEDRYLHQIIGFKTDGNRVEFSDISEALRVWETEPPSGEFRCHYHVPVHLESFFGIHTTRGHLEKLFRIDGVRTLTSLWEIETYTWSVIPEQSPLDGIAQEVEWVQSYL